MNKKKVIFWSGIVVIIIGLILFFKYNPIYATIETVTAFLLGLFAEGICKWIYDKWVKKTEKVITDTTKPNE